MTEFRKKCGIEGKTRRTALMHGTLLCSCAADATGGRKAGMDDVNNRPKSREDKSLAHSITAKG